MPLALIKWKRFYDLAAFLFTSYNLDILFNQSPFWQLSYKVKKMVGFYPFSIIFYSLVIFLIQIQFVFHAEKYFLLFLGRPRSIFICSCWSLLVLHWALNSRRKRLRRSLQGVEGKIAKHLGGKNHIKFTFFWL